MAILDNFINNEYALFLITLIGTILFVTLAYIILRFVVKRIAGRRKNYREFILKKLSKPVLLIVFFIGLYTALKSLQFLNVYGELIDGGIFIIVTLLSAALVSNIIAVIMLGYLKVKKGFERAPGLLNKSLSDKF